MKICINLSVVALISSDCFFNINIEIMNIDSLQLKLKGNLPGLSSQIKMAPAHREMELMKVDYQKFNPKLSAVIILLYHENSSLKIIFIRRSVYVGLHSGQIAFPGGKYEKRDKNLLETAKREMEEELGISRNSYQILGQLTDLYVPPSNFLLRSYLAYTEDKPQIIIDEREVQDVLIFDFEQFKQSDVIKLGDFKAHNSEKLIKAPYYGIDGNIIWGATAMVMSELIDLDF